MHEVLLYYRFRFIFEQISYPIWIWKFLAEEDIEMCLKAAKIFLKEILIVLYFFRKVFLIDRFIRYFFDFIGMGKKVVFNVGRKELIRNQKRQVVILWRLTEKNSRTILRESRWCGKSGKYPWLNFRWFDHLVYQPGKNPAKSSSILLEGFSIWDQITRLGNTIVGMHKNPYHVMFYRTIAQDTVIRYIVD